MNKQFLVFIFFLLLSSIFWLTLTLNESYEHEIQIPVHVTGIPRNVVLTSREIDTIRVTVRDKGWIIMSYLYTDKRPPIAIPFKNYDRGKGYGIVGSTELKKLVEQALEVSSKVVSVKPEQVEYSYNNGQQKRVPVRWTGHLIPDQLFFISQVLYSPDSVSVYAPKDKLDSIQVIYTEPLNQTNFRDTLCINCRLAHTADIKVVPDHIQLYVYTDVLTEETMSNIPIQCINLPEGKVLRTFPTKAKVHFVAGASQIRSLRPEDFLIIADYKEITEKSQEKCTLYLRHVPAGISRATLDASQVDYLIEEE